MKKKSTPKARLTRYMWEDGKGPVRVVLTSWPAKFSESGNLVEYATPKGGVEFISPKFLFESKKELIEYKEERIQVELANALESKRDIEERLKNVWAERDFIATLSSKPGIAGKFVSIPIKSINRWPSALEVFPLEVAEFLQEGRSILVMAVPESRYSLVDIMSAKVLLWVSNRIPKDSHIRVRLLEGT